MPMKLEWDSQNNILDATRDNTLACIYNNTFKDLGQASQEAARDKPGKQPVVDTDIPFLGSYRMTPSYHTTIYL